MQHIHWESRFTVSEGVWPIFTKMQPVFIMMPLFPDYGEFRSSRALGLAVFEGMPAW